MSTRNLQALCAHAVSAEGDEFEHVWDIPFDPD